MSQYSGEDLDRLFPSLTAVREKFHALPVADQLKVLWPLSDFQHQDDDGEQAAE